MSAVGFLQQPAPHTVALTGARGVVVHVRQVQRGLWRLSFPGARVGRAIHGPRRRALAVAARFARRFC